MKYFLVGIKGSAMAALAKILYDLGHVVIGVDYEENYYTTEDMDKNIKIYNISEMVYDEEYFYVIGNAFTKHEVTKKIIKGGYKYQYYPKFLNSLFDCINIAISGTHGKTTTTTMLSCMTEKASYLIGDSNGHGEKDSEYFIYEACEYKDTFLNYFPDILVVMNIDFDHPDYFNTIDDVYKSFSKIAEQSKMIIYNGDDKYASKLNVFNTISFGFEEDNDVCVKYDLLENGYRLYIKYYTEEDEFYLNYFGEHMIYDFLAAYTVLRYIGFDNNYIKENINKIVLPRRRMETTSFDSMDVICDYAHHPNELISFYNGISLKYEDYKKIIVFEPHTNTRTIKFKREFKKVLNLFDECYLTDIFSSVREKDDDYLKSTFYDFMEMKKYSEIIKDKLIGETEAVICFVGAGNVDLKYKDFILTKKQNNIENPSKK